MVVIRCPNCHTSLMSFGGRAMVLSEPEMDALRRGEGGDFVSRRIAAERPAAATPPDPQPQEPSLPPEPPPMPSFEQPAPEPETASAPPTPQTHTISYDDIVDIHRELETCSDALEFIARMG